MIISASRRTDIPAFYPDWFIRRLEEGYVLYKNPYNLSKVRRIQLSPDTVDCIVFWTKYAEPIMEKLKIIDEKGYDYYFQYTITGFDKRIERNLPEKERVIDNFIRLSEQLGSCGTDWRFDPIMVTGEYPVSWHLEKFEELCGRLHKHTERCIISFIDAYSHIRPVVRVMPYEEMDEMAAGISSIAKKFGLDVYSCSEEIDLGKYGIIHGACIDKGKIEQITGARMDLKKDTGQRPECGCVKSIDIGAYNTCGFDCSYCYAALTSPTGRKMYRNSPLITGYPGIKEEIIQKEIKSDKIAQMSLFDISDC